MLAQSIGNYSVMELAWSPDAGRLAVTLRDESACPWYCDTAAGFIDADGTNLTVLDRAHTCFGRSCDAESYIQGAPEWTPDGTGIVYTVSTGDCYDERATCGTDIRIAGVDGKSLGLLMQGAGFPSWRK
jgi:hypothetical protein